MSSKAKHRNWWVTLPDREPFTMGGQEMTKAEALEWVRGIWPWGELKVEPSIPKTHPAQPGQG